MKQLLQGIAFSSLVAGAFAGSAQAAEILVSGDITTSTTWTADNTYNLQNQVFVKPGATLTIEAGVVVASDPGGSLAVANGAQIFVLGTKQAPVIMTSKADVATWTGGDPTTGVWRESANEWGNLTIMGDGYISENAIVTNTPVPSASNFAQMEGLSGSLVEARYGGGNDDDDSGVINNLSLRYGGKVFSFANELNGLSLGGVGRGTDIDYVEIMNNVDDGIEIWGGTVNLKHVSIWNIGDDSFDIDQGWRGKAQNVFIVQGYSLNQSQGSGVGDNAFEVDGAEQSDWQPVTTGVIYNATVVGQPIDGDGLTTWRDNARMQYRNSIFMDGGDELVRFDNLDGDGGAGYGHNGTLSWADTWTTDFSVTSTVNAPMNPADFYKSQTSGKLAEITDSVFFRNLKSSAYTEATTVGVFDASNNNELTPGFDDADAPIRSLTRGPQVTKGGKQMLQVVKIDPRPANAALTNVGTAPNDGFFTSQNYRGAFGPGQVWLCGWSAADAFGFLDVPAEVATRTSVNNVQNSLTTNGLPTLGNASFGFTVDDPAGTCGITPGVTAAVVAITLGGQANLPLPGFGCNGGTGDVLINTSLYQTKIGVYTGGPVVLNAPVPAIGTLCGAQASAQAAFVNVTNGVITLGDAVDMTLGM